MSEYNTCLSLHELVQIQMKSKDFSVSMQSPRESDELEESQRSSRDQPRPSCLMVSKSSSSSSSSLLDDYIGMESCVDLCVMEKNKNDVDRAESKRPDKWNKRWRMKDREFPPPIPLLARTENLSSHMPWVLKRQYTGDGRLILTEEKVKHHEYFRAHRCNGRLTLHLVPLDQDDLTLLPPPPFPGACEEAESEFNNVEGEERRMEDQDEIDQSRTIGGGSGKCLNYDDARASGSPCRLRAAVTAARFAGS